MKIKNLNTKNMVTFSLDPNGYVVRYNENGIVRQMGSNSRSEMAEFAKVLSKELLPKVGIVEN